MARNLERYQSNFQSTRPLTDYYIQSRKASIPVLQRFLSAIVNSNKYCKKPTLDLANMFSSSNHDKIIGNCTATVLYKDFVSFQDSGRFQSTMTQTTFIGKIKNISGIQHKKTSGVISFELDLDAIRTNLIQNYEFDEDAYFE